MGRQVIYVQQWGGPGAEGWQKMNNGNGSNVPMMTDANNGNGPQLPPPAVVQGNQQRESMQQVYNPGYPPQQTGMQQQQQLDNSGQTYPIPPPVKHRESSQFGTTTDQGMALRDGSPSPMSEQVGHSVTGFSTDETSQWKGKAVEGNEGGGQQHSGDHHEASGSGGAAPGVTEYYSGRAV